jgi:hypothetical protein
MGIVSTRHEMGRREERQAATRREMVPDPFLFWFSGKGCGLFDRKNPDASRNCDQAMAV